MALWQEKWADLKECTDTERLLQLLECLAEDELYRDHDCALELETLERLIRTKTELLSLQDAKERLKHTIKTAKEFIRFSIFTIDEEAAAAEEARDTLVDNYQQRQSQLETSMPFDLSAN